VGLLNPRVPAPLAGLVHRLVAFQPEARPGSARALAEVMSRALAEAGAEWDKPLFEWYEGPAPDTRTTGEGAPPGPVAPGQEVALRLARMRHLDGVQRHREARRVRRRERAEVLTLAGAEGGGPARGFPRRRLAWAAGALAVAAVLGWALARPGPRSPSVPPGSFPGGRQLALPDGPPDTSVSASTFPLPSLSPPWPEDTMPTAESQAACLTRLQRYALAVSAAVSLTACPAAQGRPDAARCPSEALEAMRQLGLRVGYGFRVILDPRTPEGTKETNRGVVLRDGPITSMLRDEQGKLPAGSLLYGQVWTTDGEYAFGRYTRVKTPDGREYPVCFRLSNEEGLPKGQESRPGYTVVIPQPSVHVVDRFP
jgi:serine/threonine-protein kinase